MQSDWTELSSAVPMLSSLIASNRFRSTVQNRLLVALFLSFDTSKPHLSLLALQGRYSFRLTIAVTRWCTLPTLSSRLTSTSCKERPHFPSMRRWSIWDLSRQFGELSLILVYVSALRDPILTATASHWLRRSWALLVTNRSKISRWGFRDSFLYGVRWSASRLTHNLEGQETDFSPCHRPSRPILNSFKTFDLRSKQNEKSVEREHPKANSFIKVPNLSRKWNILIGDQTA